MFVLIGCFHTCKQREPILYKTSSSETYSSIVVKGVEAAETLTFGHWVRHTIDGHTLQITSGVDAWTTAPLWPWCLCLTHVCDPIALSSGGQIYVSHTATGLGCMKWSTIFQHVLDSVGHMECVLLCIMMSTLGCLILVVERPRRDLH